MPSTAPGTPNSRGGNNEETPPDSPKAGFLLGGTYDISDVVVGVKLFIQKPIPSGGVEERRAEILSIRDRPVSLFAPSTSTPSDPRDDKEYYVHYSEFNKRLDEWVGGSRLVLERDLEKVKPVVVKKKDGKDKDGAGGSRAGTPGTPGTPAGRAGASSLLKKATKGRKGLDAIAKGARKKQAMLSAAAGVAAGGIDDTPGSSPAPGTPTGAGGMGGDDEDDDAEGEDDDVDADGDVDMDSSSLPTAEAGDGTGLSAPSNPQAAPAVFSKEQEIEKLRTSGSMTQSHSEISRVKNLNKLQIGKHEVEAWYFSPYPAEYAHLPMLYICEFCLSFYPSPTMLRRHRTKCTLQHPPGNEIYRHEDISFFEIDGRRQRTWCRNLCLISKCFLDHKTLYYDVDPFMYYCMCQRDATGCHLIGYFSKEKESADGYNVACILTLPQHQRQQFGKLLIEFSYELSKVEKKLGSPEKPLSDLGLLGYRAYWSETIVELLLKDGGEELSVEDIANRTAITTADVMHTCQANQMIRFYKGAHVLCLSDSVIERHERQKLKKRRRIDPSKLNWKPPIFTRSQLAFGY